MNVYLILGRTKYEGDNRIDLVGDEDLAKRIASKNAGDGYFYEVVVEHWTINSDGSSVYNGDTKVFV